MTTEHRALQERVQAIKREMEGLRDGQEAEARELQGALRETVGRMQQIEMRLRGGEGPPERQRLIVRLEELKRAIGRAREARHAAQCEGGDRVVAAA